VALDALKPAFARALELPRDGGGFGAGPHADHGRLAIAAITACTNTSNPALMMGAGLLAQKAVERGLRPPAYVKTSLAPGSRVVIEYLRQAGLLEHLEQLGFFTVGFGCTTCSGKSGPIDPELERRAHEEGAVLAAVLSGNRNFDGRIHKSVRAAYLASPMLVVAFALAGRVDIDFALEPVGTDTGGEPVFLADLWPTPEEISAMTEQAANPRTYRRNYADVFAGTAEWQKLAVQSGPLFQWDPSSTYIKRPPFFDPDFLAGRQRLADRLPGARVLARFGDSLTTDHVTPSGEIPADTLAGRYLLSQGVEPADFNAYTQRRGNHEVLVRATFANPRIRNLMLDGREGGYTRHFPEGEEMAIYEAAERYLAENTPMIVLAGHDYGMGSSRDWAAKGPALLGLSMVMARSFERIHRSNLVGVGILPALFAAGEDAETLGLDGSESYDIEGIAAGIAAGAPIRVTATRSDGSSVSFALTAALYGRDERQLMQSGGIFSRIFHRLSGSSAA
jgi:aconitate hydratase